VSRPALSLVSRLDRATRTFWRVAGRPVDLAGAEWWLAAPMHDAARVGAAWLPAGNGDDGTRRRCRVARRHGAAGRTGVRGGDLRPEVRDFYEHTARWRLDVRTRWNPLFRPAGELVSRLFGRRVRQLALPTRPIDVAHGMDSRVVPIPGADGRQRAAAWLRTLRSTGEYVYSGCYTARLLPGSAQPSVHVAFPLEEGNVQVFLRPSVSPGGALRLDSGAGAFGEDGAYVVVDAGGRAYAARVPLRETFRVDVDAEGVLRADHVLCLWSAEAVRLHYRLTRSG
jgi:hypothetical protein